MTSGGLLQSVTTGRDRPIIANGRRSDGSKLAVLTAVDSNWKRRITVRAY